VRGKYIDRMLARLRCPTPCAVCHLWSAQRLCADCTSRYAPLRPRCRQCAIPVPDGVARCGACITEPPPFAACVAASDYAFPWSGLIAALKFRQAVDLVPALSQRLAEAVRAAPGLPPRPDGVLPVPLFPTRLRERGMNQAWELARHAARLLGLPARSRLLERVIDTPHLADLARDERARRIRGAFHAPRPDEVQGRRLALVDDVLTTGATAAEAARTLLSAGALEVQVWVLARTLPPTDA
jgi:ComF family protein